MKEFDWPLEKAYEEVKKRRSVIRPNPGFMQQLVTYKGILDARCVIVPVCSVTVQSILSPAA